VYEQINVFRGTGLVWAADWDMLGFQDKPFHDAGIQHIPTLTGGAHWDGPRLHNLHELRETPVLFTFNEPNDPNEANIPPIEAAAMWPKVEAAAKAQDVLTLVGPSVNWALGDWHDPEDWYDAFMEHCKNCRIDAIAIHIYNCNVDAMKNRIDKFRKYEKPIWVTEFACADDPGHIVGNTQWSKTWEWQCQYMQEVVPYLEAEPLVHGYFWFSYGDPGAPDGYVGESALVDSRTGIMTDLGKCYTKLAPRDGAGGAVQVSGAVPGGSTMTTTMTTMTTMSTMSTMSEHHE